MLGTRTLLSLVLAVLVGLSYTAGFGFDGLKQDGKPTKKDAGQDEKKADKTTDEKPGKDDKGKGDDQPSESGLSDARTIDFINKQIEKGWKDNKIQPSVNATDYEWIRRAFIDMIGRIPTAVPTATAKEDKILAKGELEYFLDLPANGRRSAVLRYLLNLNRFALIGERGVARDDQQSGHF